MKESKQFEGTTPPQERKTNEPKNFGEFLPRVANLTGRPIEELKKSFGESWYNEEINTELLEKIENGTKEFIEWAALGEIGKYSHEEGKSKLADYEAVAMAMRAYKTAKILEKQNPVLCADHSKLEEKFNEFEKEMQKLEKVDTSENKIARQILLQGRNAMAYLLDKNLAK
ncbi:MAG: hypothetical protein Q8N28_00275 [bacterium]|nr:hypothetical protein [bacterium]